MSNLEIHLAAAGAAASLLIHAWQKFREPILKVYQTLKDNGGIKGITLALWRGEQKQIDK